jgi:hypothetical protein
MQCENDRNDKVTGKSANRSSTCEGTSYFFSFFLVDTAALRLVEWVGSSDLPSEVSTAGALDLPLPHLTGAAFCFFGFGWGFSSSSEVISSLPGELPLTCNEVFAGGDAGCRAGAGDGGSGGGGAGKFSRVANGLDTAGLIEHGIGRGRGMLRAGKEGGGVLGGGGRFSQMGSVLDCVG